MNAASCIHASFFDRVHVTVPTIWESTRPVLCSKLPFFKTSWQILDMPLELSLPFSSLPYLRALKWGTIWPYTSRGIKNTSSQSWKFNFYLVNLDFSTLTCCIFDTLWGIGSYSTSFESSQMWYRSDQRAKLWQHFYYLSAFLKKCLFTT